MQAQQSANKKEVRDAGVTSQRLPAGPRPVLDDDECCCCAPQEWKPQPHHVNRDEHHGHRADTIGATLCQLPIHLVPFPPSGLPAWHEWHAQHRAYALGLSARFTRPSPACWCRHSRATTRPGPAASPVEHIHLLPAGQYQRQAGLQKCAMNLQQAPAEALHGVISRCQHANTKAELGCRTVWLHRSCAKGQHGILRWRGKHHCGVLPRALQVRCEVPTGCQRHDVSNTAQMPLSCDFIAPSRMCSKLNSARASRRLLQPRQPLTSWK